MNIKLSETRSRILSQTRVFFLSRGFLEVDTPILSPALIPESCLEVFRTEFDNPFLGRTELYLAPSPELWMKRIIAETRRNVFQVCKCFRNAETIGRIHNPEFTMLEYYGVGSTSADNIALTEELFASCAGTGTHEYARPPFRRMTMAQAFFEFAGMDLAALQDPSSLAGAARDKGLLLPEGSSWEDSFNIVFLSLVEPRLPGDRPLVLEEYPCQIACLARDLPGGLWKDRWELYVNGVELANCYAEATDVETIRAIFDEEALRKASSRVPHRIDFPLIESCRDLPPCSRVAMGFDRFVMTLAGAASIDEVLPFPFSRILGEPPQV
jgi:lysyl-tRNA synthetase class 2